MWRRGRTSKRASIDQYHDGNQPISGSPGSAEREIWDASSQKEDQEDGKRKDEDKESAIFNIPSKIKDQQFQWVDEKVTAMRVFFEEIWNLKW